MEKVIGLETMASQLKYATHYHQWLLELGGKYIGNVVLDIGGGWGSYIALLKTRVEKIIFLDRSEDAINEVKRAFCEDIETIMGDISNPSLIKLLSIFPIDTSLCFNVLEHIEDDFETIKNIYQILKPTSGHLILIVPAHKVLYGKMDMLAGHYRRYNDTEIKRLLKLAGFDIIECFYFNYLGFMGWFINQKLFPPKRLSTDGVNMQIAIYDKMIPFIKQIEKIMRLPFGQSLFAVGKAL